MQQAPTVGSIQSVTGEGTWSYSFPAEEKDTVSIKTNAKGEVQIEVVVNRADAAEAAKVAKEVFTKLKDELSSE